MKLFYRDYHMPSYSIDGNGYFDIPEFYNEKRFYSLYNEVVTDKTHQFYVDKENSNTYCENADLISTINENKSNFFDFDKALVDIGAKIGSFEFTTYFKNAYAFEPSRERFTLMNMNLLMRDKFDTVKTYNALLSNKIEDVLYNGSYTIMDDQINLIDPTQCYVVRSNMLDQYNLENIGLIKVNVNGMEEKVLQGGIGTIIRNNYPPILFELWYIAQNNMNKHKHDSLVNFLNNLGYEIIWNYDLSGMNLALHK